MPADCFFLDVGQGTSQVICLGGKRAIVIDGGPSAEIPLILLCRYVDTIEALFVSHNDADHHRGVIQILQQYRGAIKQFYFLEDRPLDEIGLYRLAKELMEDKSIGECLRLERNENYHVLYKDEQADLYLELLFPTVMDNLGARTAGDSNSTSAVLALHCGKRRIVFSGDATIEAWQTINNRVGGPSPSDIFVVPHHGGIVWPERQRRSPSGGSRLAFE
jgi:beta-lactamase superfamily II metal-dependent hydrolase